MKRGRKPLLASEKRERGTYRRDRDHGGGPASLSARANGNAPIPPDWLTVAGRTVWEENLLRVVQTGAATEIDSSAFATFCNMAGALALAWHSGDVPPTSFVRQTRIYAEAFGLFGYLSRVRG